MAARSSRGWPAALDRGGDWLAETAAELAHLGFELHDGSRPGTYPGPRLLVALRDMPTLEHFDPELVTFWEVRDGRGHLAYLDRDAALPLCRPFSWGRIHVSDRIPVSNEFLSFGGTLLGDRLDEHTVLLAFTSPAPIQRWAGHSQGVDPYVDDIGAFFGRLMVPVDFQPDAEARIAQADAQVLYAAFLAYGRRRLHPGSRLRDADPGLAQVLDHEALRLEHEVPEVWRAGLDLVDWLDLV